MIVGAVCLSHSPLMEKMRAPAEVETRFHQALDQAAEFVARVEPDLILIIYPDHFNGFFYGQLPCFCIGVRAESIGDYGSVPGMLDVPEGVALDCAEACVAASIDMNVAYCMRVDHGAAQPIEMLSRAAPIKNVIPIFVNCIARPRPSFRRARELGSALGKWAQKRAERILFVGSGGLSHDPPLPSFDNAAPDVRARLITGCSASHAERTARQLRAMQAASDSAGNKLRPLNPEWDRAVLKAFACGDLGFFDNSTDVEITEVAGSGAHELRAWMTALSAVKCSGEFDSNVLFYEPIREWLTGMAVMTTATTQSP